MLYSSCDDLDLELGYREDRALHTTRREPTPLSIFRSIALQWFQEMIPLQPRSLEQNYGYGTKWTSRREVGSKG